MANGNKSFRQRLRDRFTSLFGGLKTIFEDMRKYMSQLMDRITGGKDFVNNKFAYEVAQEKEAAKQEKEDQEKETEEPDPYDPPTEEQDKETKDKTEPNTEQKTDDKKPDPGKYKAAIRLCIQRGDKGIAVADLQKELKIGYEKASNIMNTLIKDGAVEKTKPGKPYRINGNRADDLMEKLSPYLKPAIEYCHTNSYVKLGQMKKELNINDVHEFTQLVQDLKDANIIEKNPDEQGRYNIVGHDEEIIPETSTGQGKQEIMQDDKSLQGESDKEKSDDPQNHMKEIKKAIITSLNSLSAKTSIADREKVVEELKKLRQEMDTLDQTETSWKFSQYEKEQFEKIIERVENKENLKPDVFLSIAVTNGNLAKFISEYNKTDLDQETKNKIVERAVEDFENNIHAENYISSLAYKRDKEVLDRFKECASKGEPEFVLGKLTPIETKTEIARLESRLTELDKQSKTTSKQGIKKQVDAIRGEQTEIPEKQRKILTEVEADMEFLHDHCKTKDLERDGIKRLERSLEQYKEKLGIDSPALEGEEKNAEELGG